MLSDKRSRSVAISTSRMPKAQVIASIINALDDKLRIAFHRISQFTDTFRCRQLDTAQIETLIQLCPTNEEVREIEEAQVKHPEVPLDAPEKYLMALHSIADVQKRLGVWLFTRVQAEREKDIARSLFVLQQGIEQVRKSVLGRCLF